VDKNELLAAFAKFAVSNLPEIPSYTVKEDPREKFKRLMMKMYADKLQAELTRKNKKNLSKRKMKKIAEKTMIEFSGQYGYESFIEAFKTHNYYNLFLKEVMRLSRGFEGKNILSIGSGLSVAEMFLAKNIYKDSRIICTDFSREILRQAKEMAESNKVAGMEFVVADARRLPFKKEKKFNAVWILGALSFAKDEKFRRQVESLANETVISL